MLGYLVQRNTDGDAGRAVGQLRVPGGQASLAHGDAERDADQFGVAELDAGPDLTVVDVIIDDRQVRAGVKFSDAELVGIPFRVTIGKRGLADGIAELTDRATGETVKVPLDEIAERVRKTVAHAIAGNS